MANALCLVFIICFVIIPSLSIGQEKQLPETVILDFPRINFDQPKITQDDIDRLIQFWPEMRKFEQTHPLPKPSKDKKSWQGKDIKTIALEMSPPEAAQAGRQFLEKYPTKDSEGLILNSLLSYTNAVKWPPAKMHQEMLPLIKRYGWKTPEDYLRTIYQTLRTYLLMDMIVLFDNQMQKGGVKNKLNSSLRELFSSALDPNLQRLVQGRQKQLSDLLSSKATSTH